ncbi:MAG: hypothetical protein K2P81_17290 [Bacteriovoracaceae bacterium]|nr:hypothetical protein [Bacteriovoracaceae bacterium]
MKTIIILTLLILSSCGKKTQPPYYTVDPQSIGLDSDGDGALDWDEIEMGQDPKLANIDLDLINPENKVTIIDDLGNEKEILTIKVRSLREALLNRYHYKEIELPLINETLLSFDHLKDFWILKSGPTKSYKARLNADSNNQIILDDVQSNLGDFGFNLKPKASLNKIIEVFSKTYRLVISTPEREFIYHLTPDVDPLKFLSTKHTISIDQENRIIGIDKYIQNFPHPLKNDYSSDQSFWINVDGALDLNFEPKIGQTYALVFSTLDEIQNHTIKGIHSADSGSRIFNPKKTITMTSVVKIPRLKRLNWEDRQEGLYWDEGTGDRSRDRHCFFWTKTSKGYQDYRISSEDELKSILDIRGARLKKSTLLHMSDSYSTYLVELETNASEFVFGVMNKDRFPAIPIGVYKSECGARKNLNYQELPLWQDVTLQYHWLSK